MANFGERLERIRKERKLTQKQLADASGVPYMTIYRLEKGIYEDTSTVTARKLARVLGVSLDVLAGLYEETDTESEEEPAVV
jgi:transcriptional regulator with XRE-family HTH domain